VVAGSVTGGLFARPPGIAAAVSSKSGLAALFTRAGDYAVTVASIHVAFTGQLNATPTSVLGSRGSDSIGAYATLTAEYTANGTRRRASIRIYDGHPLALFETRYLSEAANTDPFPVLTSTPALPYQMGYRDSGFGNLPVCVAKTQYSLSDDPKLHGAPTGWDLHISDVSLSAGAGFLVCISGNMMLMPGLPKVSRAEVLDVDADGNVVGMS